MKNSNGRRRGRQELLESINVFLLSSNDAMELDRGRDYSGSRATSTKLSKNVAAAPRSVSLVLVVVLQFAPSVVYLFHQTPKETTTPAFTVSPTTALARNDPRSLNMR